MWPKTLHGLCESQLSLPLGHTGALHPLGGNDKAEQQRMEGRPGGLEGVREECRQRFSQGGRQGPDQVWLLGWAAPGVLPVKD